MGWSSGSTLMDEAIKSLKKYVPDAAARQGVYFDLIIVFDDQDWDTHDECVGKDPSFDAALKAHYPHFFDEI
jgi:hypothetical protein